MKHLNSLLGKTIKSIEISTDKIFLKFYFENGEEIWVQAATSCCDNSWIEHISGTNELIGNKINNISEKYISGAWDSDDYLQIYSYTFETDTGRFDVELRNTSNGYYGGSLDIFSKDLFDHWLKRVPERLPVMKPLTEDF